MGTQTNIKHIRNDIMKVKATLIYTAAVSIAISIIAGLRIHTENKDCGFVVKEDAGLLVPLNSETKKPIGLFERIGKNVSLNTVDGGFKDVTECLKHMGYSSWLENVMPYLDTEGTVLIPGSKDVIEPPADIDHTKI